MTGVMPRSRAPEIPQRPSPRPPANLRTSSADSDPTHHRSRTERSPKLASGRSPRGSLSDPLSQKKLGTRIAGLESQLGQAQDELKCLKDQLSSAEAARKAAQEQLEKKGRKLKKVPKPVGVQEKLSPMVEPLALNKKESTDECETSDDVEKETDVFEVQVDSHADQDGAKPKPSFDESALKEDETNMMKIKLDEREKELENLRQENARMKAQLDEKSMKLTSVESQMEELKSNLNNVNHELEKSRSRETLMGEKLVVTEKAKEELEEEMKRLRVQTEQWRKAADAAASVLAGEVETNERRISERCGSMEKSCGNVFESSGGRYGGYVETPGGVDDGDDVFGGGRRKGSGIKMFGDLWKKKGHK